MQRTKLIQSVQGGPFDSKFNRMIDLVLEGDQVVNMAETYVILTSRLVNTPPNILNICPFNTVKPQCDIFNLDLIRNCSMTSELCGRLEDVRRVNVLSHNLKELTTPTSQKDSQILSLNANRDYASGQLLSPYVQWEKRGDTPSTYTDLKLRIPLSDLFSLGKETNLNMAQLGRTTIHLELENTISLGLELEPLFTGISGEGILEDVISGSQFDVLNTYFPLSNSPYHVGQWYNISYENAASQTITSVVEIESIDYGVGGQLKLTLNGENFPLPDQGGGDIYSNIVLTQYNTLPATPISAQLALAELMVAEVLNDNTPSAEQLQYMTFLTEEYTAAGQQFVNKIFQVEPEAVNAFVMFNDPTSGSLLSNNNGVASYRLRNGDKDIYNREIQTNKANGNANFSNVLFHDSLHYDSLNRTLMNAGLPINNLMYAAKSRDGQSVQLAPAATTLWGSPFNQILILACPLPMTDIPKQLQVNITCYEQQVVQNLIVFKQVVKTIELGGGGGGGRRNGKKK